MEHHPLCYYENLRKFCAENKIYYEGYSSLGTKFLGIVDREDVKKMAEKYKKEPGQILLKWSVQKDISIIPKSSNADRLK